MVKIQQTSLATDVMNLSSCDITITPPFHAIRAAISASKPWEGVSILSNLGTVIYLNIQVIGRLHSNVKVTL